MATFFNDPKQSANNSGSSFGRKKETVANAIEAIKKETHPARTQRDNEDVDFRLPETLQPRPQIATNTNKLAPVKPLALPEPPKVSPFLEKAYKSIWHAIKTDADFRRYASMPREMVIEDIQMFVQEAVRLQELNLSDTECETIGNQIVDEMLGLGPIEFLLARDEISEIMVNGPKTVYLEMNGKIERSAITFRDNEQLVAICQRIASQVGRRVDESSPICDARLSDGSRVNIILPPLALDGAVLTIRKFQKEKLTLEKITAFGSVDETMAEMIRIMAACRVNILVSGGTGSGKTTMLNCLTAYINPRERIVTCEDAAELQLQQPHVVRLETRPPNLEGIGEVTMRDLVRNCLRMRPDRIILGEVRGAEAFDLLQAMNTGHDGSMGTIHANTPRDALARLENMIATARLNLPNEVVRKQIAASVNVLLQIQRLNDGSRKVVSITEITGMEGDTISMQDLVVYELQGEDENGRLLGNFRATGLRPKFADKLRQFNMEKRFLKLLEKTVQQ